MHCLQRHLNINKLTLNNALVITLGRFFILQFMILQTDRNVDQSFALTCAELVTLANPVFFFLFINEMTKEVQEIYLEDRSRSKNRYNLFVLPANFLPADGWYTFKVYECVNEVSPVGAMVELGRAFVGEMKTVFNQFSENVNFKEYDPE